MKPSDEVAAPPQAGAASSPQFFVPVFQWTPSPFAPSPFSSETGSASPAGAAAPAVEFRANPPLGLPKPHAEHSAATTASLQMILLHRGAHVAAVHLERKTNEVAEAHGALSALLRETVENAKFTDVLKQVEHYYAKKTAKRKTQIVAGISPFAKPDYRHRFTEEYDVLKYCRQKYALHHTLSNHMQFLATSLPPSLREKYAKKLTALEIAHEAKALKWRLRANRCKSASQAFLLKKKASLQTLATPYKDKPLTDRVITVAVVENGRVDGDHPVFKNRLIKRAHKNGSLTDHATHVAGIILQNHPRVTVSSYSLSEMRDGAPFLNAEQVVNASVSIARPDAYRTFAANDRVLVTSIGNDGMFISDCARKSALFEQEISSQALLVVNLNPDCMTPSSSSNLPGNRFADMTVCAPGVDIKSAIRGGEEDVKSGTSMAAPFVSAVVAAVREKHPFFTAVEAAIAVKRGAKPIVLKEDGSYTILSSRDELAPFSQEVIDRSMEIWGWGIANVEGALQAAAKFARMKVFAILNKRSSMPLAEFEQFVASTGLPRDAVLQAAPKHFSVTVLEEGGTRIELVAKKTK
jgi:hypothetical protein